MSEESDQQSNFQAISGLPMKHCGVLNAYIHIVSFLDLYFVQPLPADQFNALTKYESEEN